MQRVLDGEALAQELRVPGQLGVRARGRVRGEVGGEPVRRADGDGGLADDQRGAREVRGEQLEGPVDVRHVTGVLPVLLRGVRAHEVDVAELRDLGPVHGEAQPPGGTLDPGDVLAQQFLEPRFVHRDLAPLEHLDLLGDDVKTQHLVAQLGHGRGVRGAEIAGADHGDLEGHECSRRGMRAMRARA